MRWSRIRRRSEPCLPRFARRGTAGRQTGTGAKERGVPSAGGGVLPYMLGGDSERLRTWNCPGLDCCKLLIVPQAPQFMLTTSWPGSVQSLSFDWESDRVPPLRPRTIVIPDLGVPEEVFENEPGVGRPLSNPAVGDDLLLSLDPLCIV